jgi:hypothetical protein
MGMRHYAFFAGVIFNLLFSGLSLGQATAKTSAPATRLEARVAALEKRLAIIEAHLGMTGETQPLASPSQTARGSDVFTGKWRLLNSSAAFDVEISRQGDYFQWKDQGGFGVMQFKSKDGELVGSGLYGNVTFNKETGHILLAGREFARLQ